MEAGSLAAVIAAAGIWAGIAAMLVMNYSRARVADRQHEPTNAATPNP